MTERKAAIVTGSPTGVRAATALGNLGTRPICAVKVSVSEPLIDFPMIGMRAVAEIHSRVPRAARTVLIQEASLELRIFRRTSWSGQDIAQPISRRGA